MKCSHFEIFLIEESTALSILTVKLGTKLIELTSLLSIAETKKETKFKQTKLKAITNFLKLNNFFIKLHKTFKKITNKSLIQYLAKFVKFFIKIKLFKIIFLKKFKIKDQERF